MKTNTPILEQHCPACDRRFTFSASSRKKKVQCPHCREIVPLTLKEHEELNGKPDPEIPRDLPAAPDWMARCEMLQARIEVLEQQVEALMVSPRTGASLFSERLPDLRTGSRDHRLPDDPPESHEESPHANGSEPREVFRTEQSAAGMMPQPVFGRGFLPPTPEIGLLVPAGNEVARRVAQTLAEILARAGWKVRGVAEDKALAEDDRGLTFAAAPTLPLQRVTSTLNALREAGFAANFQINPERGAREAMLIVGSGAGSENKGD